MFIGDWPRCTLLPLEGKTRWDGASSSGAGAMFRPGSLRAPSGHAVGRGEVRALGGWPACAPQSLRACACCSLVSGLVDAPFFPPSGWGLGAGGQGRWVQALGSNRRARFAHTPWLRTAASGGVWAAWGAALPGLPRCPQGKGVVRAQPSAPGRNPLFPDAGKYM